MTRSPRRLAKFVLPLLLLIVAGGYWFASHGPIAARPAGSDGAAVPVVAGYAERRDVPIWLSGLGAVQPLQAVTVKVRVDGQLDRVMFVEGQEVRQGAVLAQIDPRPFEAQLKQAQAQAARDAAQLANARIDFERYTTLVKQDSISKQQLATQEALVEQLKAAVQADQGAIDMAQLQVQFTTITSPLDGRVGLRLVDPGSIVHATDVNGLVTVTQMEPIAALFSLSQDVLPELRENMAKGTLEVVATTRDGLQELAQGKLVFVDSQVDPATGQVRLKATFGNKGRTLWPGQFITARVLLRTEKGALTIPAKAVQNGPDGSFVYVIKPDGSVAVQPITLGSTTGAVAIVATGLEPGTHLVVEGQYRLEPGSRVEVSASAAKPGS
jgi:multidrug efflux system membrane fusion protein